MLSKNFNNELKQMWKLAKDTRKTLSEIAIAQKKYEKEAKKRQEEMDQKINKVFGTFSNNWGKLVESLVEGDLLQRLAEKGIKIDGTAERVQGVIKDSKGNIQKECEIDILARNGKEVVAVEVKSDCNKKDVDHFLDVLQDFTRYFREYKDKIVYGAMAYLRLQKGADRYAEKKGLFVVKATGNSSRITNKTNFKPKNFSIELKNS